MQRTIDSRPRSAQSIVGEILLEFRPSRLTPWFPGIETPISFNTPWPLLRVIHELCWLARASIKGKAHPASFCELEQGVSERG
jgi:hypothetical protein